MRVSRLVLAMVAMVACLTLTSAARSLTRSSRPTRWLRSPRIYATEKDEADARAAKNAQGNREAAPGGSGPAGRSQTPAVRNRRTGLTRFASLSSINLTNMACHMAFSLLVSFFPQAALARGVGESTVGLIFGTFAFVVFAAAPFVRLPMRRFGTRNVYASGVLLLALSTAAFAFVPLLQRGSLFVAACLVLRALQGLGAAMAETSAYALIASMDRENMSFNLGLTEVSTGLGYMLGPALGGLLYDGAGFAAPFVSMAVVLALASALAMATLVNQVRVVAPPKSGQPAAPLPASVRLQSGRAAAMAAAVVRAARAATRAVTEAFEPLARLLSVPQLACVAWVGLISTVGFGFLEPTLAAHVAPFAPSAAAVGALFSVPSAAYMLCAAPAGWASAGRRLGPLRVIVAGLILQTLSMLLVGPSPLLHLSHMPLEQARSLLLLALVLLGLGDALAMAPLMEGMLSSISLQSAEDEERTIEELSAIVTSCFSLGQIIGPFGGAMIASRLGFAKAATLLAFMYGIGACLLLRIYLARYPPRRLTDQTSPAPAY